VTLLSIPPWEVEQAFKSFDLDGSGEVDKDEFKEVRRAVAPPCCLSEADMDCFSSDLRLCRAVASSYGQRGSSRKRSSAFSS
jgi:hypothetical protein